MRHFIVTRTPGVVARWLPLLLLCVAAPALAQPVARPAPPEELPPAARTDDDANKASKDKATARPARPARPAQPAQPAQPAAGIGDQAFYHRGHSRHRN